ncbi:MAG: hypothetical protein A3I73_05570 [Omnitrophica bacterium RIFCSPLOWO2_02_FULL_45_16]|nr:MAG: hypothetical protein A3C51_00090 [Omnitrophica bacterium RIFCSPHIGHO2_02_FULL_46_20]OGW93238.1 MAG: hypothetical protein A3G36_01195 [Omnitrophica bacterium RIFCSPLOWO2_12_FULL_45_13]OGW93355.1 MAG: hypothetical protein A3K16_00190 [Omnitrophica bacterium RIFCSPLOWO2_01_FULL_45_24]OGX00395.1 MAG: hypothetical protein A3I73_05570 [Omnitrophica bacterium RIFCSPLOWO2_02_FULL_45_16]
MNGKTIHLDIRKLGMADRPTRIFDAWRELKKGGRLVITNDHDPKPLQYMLKAQDPKDAFSWEYKKQGPPEWTVEITKLPPRENLAPAQLEKREKLKEALKKLHESSPDELEKVKKEVEVYFKETDPKELAMAEQELIREGTTREEMKRLCDVHLEVMKNSLGIESKKIKLPAWHPIRICMDEHKVIKKNLKKLKRTLEKIKMLGSFEKSKREVNALKELSHFFIETEKHHKREEEALFPRLEAHGITEPPQIFKEDHVEFLAKKKEFYNTVMAEYKDFKKFVDAITPIIEFLAKNLDEHIYKEDNILYPMSLKTLEKNEWKEVRKKFDAIGYCCFAPADLKKEKR